MSKYPVASKINGALMQLEAFKAAHPSQQPDCPDEMKLLQWTCSTIDSFKASSAHSRVFSKTEDFFSVLKKSASTRSVFESYVRKSEPWTYAWRHRIWKLRFRPSTRIRWISVFKTLHSGERIWKPPFSGTENAGYVWTVAVFGEKVSVFQSTRLRVDGVWKTTMAEWHLVIERINK